MRGNLLTLLFLTTTSAFANNLDQIGLLDGTTSNVDGPNCWNGALYMAGTTPSKRQFLPEEWLFHLKAYCEKIEEPKRGDVGRIFHPQDGEVHGFIYLDEETIFAKHGLTTMYGYQVMSKEEMMNSYGRTRQCRIDRDFSAACFHQIEYYRCERVSSDGQLFRVEKLLESLLFSEETKFSYKDRECSGAVFSERKRILSEIESELKMIDSGKLTDEDKLALNSMRGQIYEIEVSNRSFKCKPRKQKYAPTRAVRAAMDELLK